jgi:hypothetical protein
VYHHIVGSEETVKTRRMFNTMRDNLSDDNIFNRITSGISGEGLEMKGSDIDIMFVLKDVNVYEDINSTHINSSETCVAMEMDDTKLGFSHFDSFAVITTLYLKCVNMLRMICISLVSYVNQCLSDNLEGVM